MSGPHARLRIADWVPQTVYAAERISAARERYVAAYAAFLSGDIDGVVFGAREQEWLSFEAEVLAGLRWLVEREEGRNG